MTIYFVRHGQSMLGEKWYQLSETPLSDLGIKQSEAVAERFSTIAVDLILTSSYTRAVQTAQAIKKIVSAPLEQSDLLVERKMPSSYLGKPIDDPEITSTHEKIREHFYDSDWHYEDEENFSGLFLRAKEALHLIQSQKKENSIVVTHGYFLTVMTYYILFGEKGDHRSFKSFRDHSANSNAGVTLCEYSNETWKLLTWNDTSHLGGL